MKNLRLFLTQMKDPGSPTHRVKIYQGGKLSRSSEVYELIHDDFQWGLQTAGGFLSWLNGKVETHIRTLENMERLTCYDANLPTML